MAMAGFFPRISLMVWENTPQPLEGRVIPIEVMEETSARARNTVGNASTAHASSTPSRVRVPAERWAARGTIQFCFSKGPGAPVGSIICGPADAIAEIRYLHWPDGRGHAAGRCHRGGL